MGPLGADLAPVLLCPRSVRLPSLKFGTSWAGGAERRVQETMPAYWTNFATAAAGPALACIITNPADVAKTRLNLERELQSTEMSRAC